MNEKVFDNLLLFASAKYSSSRYTYCKKYYDSLNKKYSYLPKHVINNGQVIGEIPNDKIPHTSEIILFLIAKVWPFVHIISFSSRTRKLLKGSYAISIILRQNK